MPKIGSRSKTRPLISHDDEAAVLAEYIRRSENDLVAFLNGLIIPSASGPQPFLACMQPFQLETFKQLAPSLLAVRDGRMPPKRRFWIERTKKASKDGDLAACLLWLMAFPKRPVLIQVSAANQQQAGIIKRRASDLMHYNPWLNERVKIQLNRIKGILGEVVIEATGSSGAKQGDTPDLLILNELVHVERWGVNETHMNNADGVPQGVVIISTNAGFKGTKAELWRKNAQANPKRWTVMEWKGRAPWVSAEDVEDAKRRDPIGSEFERLWNGRWMSGRGGAVIEDALDRCFVLDGPITEPEPGWRYVAGLDLGISHDHSGVVVLGANPKEQRMRIAWMHGYVPEVPNDHGQLEVDSDKVENACLSLWKTFHVMWFGYDPAAGGSFMAQRLRKLGVPMREMTFSSPKNQSDMAVAFVQAIRAGKLECYEDQEGRLRRDFGKFEIQALVPTGYRLKAVSDEWGHADVGTAVVICLPEAMRMAGFDLFDHVIYVEQKPMTDEEMLEMPEELAGICNAYDSLEARDFRHHKKSFWD